jgi:tetratricopeptide (TPR) repeat protein
LSVSRKVKVFAWVRTGLLVGCLLVTAPGVTLAGGLQQAAAGLTALAAGENQRAVTLLTEALDSNEMPESETYLFLTARGFARAASGDYKAAIVDYNTALAAHPGFAPALYNRGNAQFALHRDDLAIADYTRALELDANDSKALNNRGAAWFRKGNLQSALANYTQALQIAPDDPDILLNRGKVYEAMGEDARARDDFTRIKQIDPTARTPLD